MKKVPLIIALLALVLSVFGLTTNLNSKKQAYVEINKLVDGYQRTSKIKGDFDRKASNAKANIDSLISNWQKELQSYEKNRISMSKKELEMQQQLLSSKQQQVENYRQAIHKQLQEEDQKNTQTIFNDINEFVKKYGEKEGYVMIFGASGTGNIMYANEISDITEEVLAALNKDYNGK